jgi:hypothetical protein
LAQRVALRRESRQVQAAKVQVLKTDVRMPQQICFVICSLVELPRHGAGRQQAADSTGRSTAHDHQHGRVCPAPQRDRSPVSDRAKGTGGRDLAEGSKDKLT